MTRHCMIDIETLDTAPSAAVLSIGAVLFDMYGQGLETYYASVTVGPQLAEGRTQSEATKAWWASKPKETRDHVFDASLKVPVEQMLDELDQFLGHESGVGAVWGNGAGFDNVIVADLYRSFNRMAPWPFWNDRCFRTVKAVMDPYSKLRPKFDGVPHHALHDALHQTAWLQAIAEANPTVKF